MSFDAGLRKKIEFFHDALQEKSRKGNVGEMVEKLKFWEKGWKYFFFIKCYVYFQQIKSK